MGGLGVPYGIGATLADGKPIPGAVMLNNLDLFDTGTAA